MIKNRCHVKMLKVYTPNTLSFSSYNRDSDPFSQNIQYWSNQIHAADHRAAAHNLICEEKKENKGVIVDCDYNHGAL